MTFERYNRYKHILWRCSSHVMQDLLNHRCRLLLPYLETVDTTLFQTLEHFIIYLSCIVIDWINNNFREEKITGNYCNCIIFYHFGVENYQQHQHKLFLTSIRYVVYILCFKYLTGSYFGAFHNRLYGMVFFIVESLTVAHNCLYAIHNFHNLFCWIFVSLDILIDLLISILF